ncbi:MAG: SDR family NAD(P)-dependent oxidoreductase, partial [Rhizobiaceae bacterium]
MTKPIALIVGVGDGLSASLTRLFLSEGYKLVLAARNINKIKELANTTDSSTVQCDASSEDDVKKLFSGIEGTLRVVVYNPSARLRGSIVE